MSKYRTLYPTYVVIPFKNNAELTLHVLSLCLQEEAVNYIYLYDNGTSAEQQEILSDGLAELVATFSLEGKVIEFFYTPEMSIYQMWNDGWSRSVENENNGNHNIAFLNNDIDFWPGTITEMAKILRRESGVWITYPNYNRSKAEKIDKGAGIKFTRGTYRHGGMGGWCFMVMGEQAVKGFPKFDEQFEWWCGDDDFAFTVEQIGGVQARLMGWPIDHLVEATASNGENDWTHEAKGRDMQRLAAKWPGR